MVRSVERGKPSTKLSPASRDVSSNTASRCTGARKRYSVFSWDVACTSSAAIPCQVAPRRLTASSGAILTRVSASRTGCAWLNSVPKGLSELMNREERLAERNGLTEALGLGPGKGAARRDLNGGGLVSIGSTCERCVFPGSVFLADITWQIPIVPSYGGLFGRTNWFAPNIPRFGGWRRPACHAIMRRAATRIYVSAAKG